MSVFYCAGCNQHVDSDFEGCFEDRQSGETVCDGCYEHDCEACDGIGFAGRDPNSRCRECNGRGYVESERERDVRAYWAEQPTLRDY